MHLPSVMTKEKMANGAPIINTINFERQKGKIQANMNASKLGMCCQWLWDIPIHVAKLCWIYIANPKPNKTQQIFWVLHVYFQFWSDVLIFIETPVRDLEGKSGLMVACSDWFWTRKYSLKGSTLNSGVSVVFVEIYVLDMSCIWRVSKCHVR